MKKTLVNCLLTIVPIGLIACNGGSSNNSSSASTPENNPQNPNFSPLPSIKLSESKNHSLTEGTAVAEVSAVFITNPLFQALLTNQKSISLGSAESLSSPN